MIRIVHTIHKDMSERLPMINKSTAAEVRKVLDNNKAERHLRGGKATCLKYKNIKKRKVGRVAAQ
jgi:putative DeoR family transcriptional regulator (stage III sporulation protein D)